MACSNGWIDCSAEVTEVTEGVRHKMEVQDNHIVEEWIS